MSHRTASHLVFASIALAACAVARPARADLRVVQGQFAARVEAGRPEGNADALRNAANAAYFLVVANNGEASEVTVVWRHDGREVHRQQLAVGRAPRWRTWATHRTRGARTVEVAVLDAAGHTLHTDRATVRP